jgi:hypothetical protein
MLEARHHSGRQSNEGSQDNEQRLHGRGVGLPLTRSGKQQLPRDVVRCLLALHGVYRGHVARLRRWSNRARPADGGRFVRARRHPLPMTWPTRRTPAFARIGSLVGIVLGLVISQRQTKAAGRIGSELGTLVGSRWEAGDRRDSAMLALTRALRRLTGIVLICTIVSTAFVVYAAVP